MATVISKGRVIWPLFGRVKREAEDRLRAERDALIAERARACEDVKNADALNELRGRVLITKDPGSVFCVLRRLSTGTAAEMFVAAHAIASINHCVLLSDDDAGGAG